MEKAVIPVLISVFLVPAAFAGGDLPARSGAEGESRPLRNFLRLSIPEVCKPVWHEGNVQAGARLEFGRRFRDWLSGSAGVSICTDPSDSPHPTWFSLGIGPEFSVGSSVSRVFLRPAWVVSSCTRIELHDGPGTGFSLSLGFETRLSVHLGVGARMSLEGVFRLAPESTREASSYRCTASGGVFLLLEW